ncbi:MAG: EAL domain-containing protein [Gammaproteobacteria bacterium]
MATSDRQGSSEVWFLDHTSPKGVIGEYRITRWPFTIGRSAECDLTLRSNSVSKEHARLDLDTDGLRVVDLGSTNGTHVNGQVVHTALVLLPGDILQIGDFQFRVRKVSVSLEATSNDDESLATHTIRRSDPKVAETRSFFGLLDGYGVVPHFQPIIHLAQRNTLGYEVLARTRAPDLPPDATGLFRIAVRLGAERELSRIYWTHGVREAAALPAQTLLFVNLHPREISDPRLIDSLANVRREAPLLRIVAEVHEKAVIDLGQMHRIKDGLAAAGIGLAYDDFGAGEGRLNELAEVPPDYLKFDYSLIHDLDRAGHTKRHVVEALVQMVRGLGVVPLAEGIETEGEACLCAEIGFELAQGFFYGRPQPIAHWLPA